MIEHLLFSTRAARPASGSEFNREVVAASPGVPEAARAVFVKLADMTGSVLARPELPPLWAFRRLDEESWLVVRAVSLGLYRKGHHQLLVHGVVLPRETVDLLDGDPFLLASDEAAAAGFRFVENHPGGREELDPLALDPGFAGTARRLAVERLERLTEGLRDLDPAFPALFDRVVGTGGSERPPVAVAPGSPAVVEWLLLHLHPADRAEVSFHTRYAYEQAIPFDLVGVAPDEVADLRRRLRGEVEVWTPEAARAPTSDGAEPTLGERVRQARERAPGLLPRALESYYLTLLPGRHGTDLRRNPFHPLTPEEAAVCLRAELGLPLGDEEREVVERLSLRGDRSLARHAADLGEAWRRGPAAFEDHLRRLANAADELRRLDLDRMPPIARPEERIGLLALLPVLLPALLDESGDGEDRLPALWREVVPPGTIADLLGRLGSPVEAEIGERVVGPWIAGLLRAGGEATAGEAWPDYLRWLGAAGRPVAPVAARVERALDDAPEEAALDGYRRLERVCAEAGLAAFALRILFQREVPRLAPAAAHVRLADGVAWLLRESGEGGDPSEGADPFLGPALADPASADAVLGALAERLAASDDPEARWPRIRRLLEAQPRASLPRAAAPAAGAFVARLARSPLAERAAEALDRLAALGPDGPGSDGLVEHRFRFRDEVTTAAAAAIGDAFHGRPAATAAGHAARGLAGLLALRLEERPLGEPDRLLDRALLDALLPALVLCGPESDGGARLRTYVDRYLDRLLDLDRLHQVADPAGPWRHLLLDEIEAAPAPDPEADPRHRAALHLAWARWTIAAERPDRGARTPATVALARALATSRASRPDSHTHRALLERIVPRPHHPEAHHLLASLLPAAGGLR